jgi:hypothetical protein
MYLAELPAKSEQLPLRINMAAESSETMLQELITSLFL